MTTFTNNQNNNTNKEMVNMATVTKVAVSNKGFKRTGKAEVIMVPSKVKLVVQAGEKEQFITFGYSKHGGRTTYIQVDNRPAERMSKTQFMYRMTKTTANGKSLWKYMDMIQPLVDKNIVAGQCKNCGHNVSTHNADYIQRNYQEIGCGEHELLCTPCQQGRPVGTRCSSCNKGISKGVERYSFRAFGRPLCMDCQPKPQKKEEVKLEDVQVQVVPAELPTTPVEVEETKNDDFPENVGTDTDRELYELRKDAVKEAVDFMRVEKPSAAESAPIQPAGSPSGTESEQTYDDLPESIEAVCEVTQEEKEEEPVAQVSGEPTPEMLAELEKEMDDFFA